MDVVFHGCDILRIFGIYSLQSGILRESVIRHWRPWKCLVYFTSVITDICHKVIYLLTFCLSGKKTLERKVTVLSKAVPFGCEIGQFMARFVAGVHHDDCMAGQFWQTLTVYRCRSVCGNPSRPGHPPVKDVGVARHRIIWSLSDGLFQNCQSHLSANGLLFSAIFYIRRSIVSVSKTTFYIILELLLDTM